MDCRILLSLMLGACAAARPGAGSPGRATLAPVVVETPTLGLYACRGSVCERKERWFQPAGEPARCSCARGRVDEPCNCEHELVGLYRLVVASTLAPPPDVSSAVGEGLALLSLAVVLPAALTAVATKPANAALVVSTCTL